MDKDMNMSKGGKDPDVALWETLAAKGTGKKAPIATERALYAWLSSHVTGAWTRIENSVTPGVPDCHVVLDRCEVWIELKVVHSQSSTVKLRSAQLSWILRHTEAGGCAVVLVGTPTGMHIAPVTLGRVSGSITSRVANLSLIGSTFIQGYYSPDEVRLAITTAWAKATGMYVRGGRRY